MDEILADGSRSDRPDPTEVRLAKGMTAFLVIATLFFTALHHLYPAALNVPPRTYFDKALPDGAVLLGPVDRGFIDGLPPAAFALSAPAGSCLVDRSSGECRAGTELKSDRWVVKAPEESIKRGAPGPEAAQRLEAGAVLRLFIPFTDYPSMFLLDLIPIGLAGLCFHHARRRLGIYRAMLFLGGSFIFTGLEESMWILLGRFQTQLQALGGSELQEAALGEAGRQVTGTYYFTRGFFWFLETPLLACLGWFFVAYACVYVADLLLPKARVVYRAALGGLLAMNLDLWLDPVQTHHAFLSWIWAEGDRIKIFSIPFSNFAGWFLLIFLFAIVFDRVPAMIRRWGRVKTAAIFYAVLFALELGILLFFAVYGTIAMRLLPEPINFTIWGIGVRNLTM